MGQAKLYGQQSGGLDINGIIQDYYVYAGENVSAGDFVEFVNGVASQTTSVSEGKDLSTLSYSGRDTKAALLKNGNIFIVFTSGTDEDVLNCMVVSSDGVNLTPHTSVQLGTSRGYHSRPIVLDNGKVFFTYGSGSKSYLYGSLIAINGTVPSIVVNIGIDTNDSYTGRGSNAVGLGNNRIFVTRTYEGRFASGVVVTATDTTLTKGTEVALHPDWESPNYEKDCCVLTSGKVFVAWSDNAGEFLLGTVCSVSGTTITPLTVDPVQIVNTGDIASSQYVGQSFSITALPSGNVFISHSYYDNMFKMGMTVCTVNGTTITANTDYRPGSYKCRSLDQILLPDGNVFVAHTGTGGSFSLNGMVVKINGTTPSVLKDVELDGAETSVGDVSTILDRNNNIFISHTDPNDKNYLHGQIFSIIDNTPTPTIITSVYETQVRKSTTAKFGGVAKTNGVGGTSTGHKDRISIYTL